MPLRCQLYFRSFRFAKATEKMEEAVLQAQTWLCLMLFIPSPACGQGCASSNQLNRGLSFP